MKFKLKPLEKKGILYDIGNSAFALLISTIIPIYFNYLAGDAGISEVNYMAYWGYATSEATVIVAVLAVYFLDLCSPGFGFCCCLYLQNQRIL